MISTFDKPSSPKKSKHCRPNIFHQEFNDAEKIDKPVPKKNITVDIVVHIILFTNCLLEKGLIHPIKKNQSSTWWLS